METNSCLPAKLLCPNLVSASRASLPQSWLAEIGLVGLCWKWHQRALKGWHKERWNLFNVQNQRLTFLQADLVLNHIGAQITPALHILQASRTCANSFRRERLLVSSSSWPPSLDCSDIQAQQIRAKVNRGNPRMTGRLAASKSWCFRIFRHQKVMSSHGSVLTQPWFLKPAMTWFPTGDSRPGHDSRCTFAGCPGGGAQGTGAGDRWDGGGNGAIWGISGSCWIYGDPQVTMSTMG